MHKQSKQTIKVGKPGFAEIGYPLFAVNQPEMI